LRLFTFKVPDDFNLFLQGDAHKYTRAHSKEGYKLLFDSINSEFEGIPAHSNYTIEFGDFADLIPIRHKYYDPEVHKLPPLEQIELFLKEYEFIVHALLFMLDSTHPQMLAEMGNITKFVCHELQQRYTYLRLRDLFGTQTARADFRALNGDRIFKLYCTHGTKGLWSAADDDIRIDANLALSLKRHLRKKGSDCAIMARGHTHKLIVQEPKPKLCIIDNGQELISKYPKPGDYHSLDTYRRKCVGM